MLKFTVLAISMMIISVPAVNFILPEIRDYLGITQAQSELISTLPSLTTLITLLFVSFITKSIGIKKTVFIGLLITGLSGVIPVFTSSFILIIISRSILGIGLGLYSPLAIELINLLFAENERAKLMGFRGAAEQLGRSLLTLVAGLLFIFGWNLSFIVYGLAFILALLFYHFVPEVNNQENGKDEANTKVQTKKRLSPVIYLIAIFMSVAVFNGAAIDIRFPALAAEIMGEGFNSSYIIALKPVLGIFAGLAFGKLYLKFGKKLLYFSIASLILAGILVANSGSSMIPLTIGFYLAGLVPAWIGPFVFMTIAKKVNTANRELAMSILLVALHGTVFLMTPVVRLIEHLLGNDALTAPYPVLSGLLFVTLVGMWLFAPKLMRKY